MRGKRILFCMVLVGFLAGTAAFAQGFPQAMRGQVKRVDFTDIFGPCNDTGTDPCRLHYEYWTPTSSGQVNLGGPPGTANHVSGVPQFLPRGTGRGDYATAQAILGNFPGAPPGATFYLQHYGYRNGGTPNYIGYYAVQGQIVNLFETGNFNNFDCSIDHDPSLGPNQMLSALVANAGRTGSKINVYILKAVFSDGTFLVGDPVVVDLTDVL